MTVTRTVVVVVMASLWLAACHRREAPDSHAASGHAPAAAGHDHAHAHGGLDSSTPASDERASAVHINDARPAESAPAGMVWIPGGTFWMGCEGCSMPDALPAHIVEVDGFWMDEAPVTNAEFSAFVAATGYVTVAERRPDPREFPGVPLDQLLAGSVVFTPPAHVVSLDDYRQWWRYVPGASWRHPTGPGSAIAGRGNEPVVHVAWDDVSAYATWTGKRLPTEAEFEFAARGRLDRQRYPWGNELTPGGVVMANNWQGRFPSTNTKADGYAGTSPVRVFPANGFGLYDMGGNVWQWCADWYRSDTYADRADRGVARNPTGPDRSFDPDEPGAAKRVVRGGSFLCSDEYCTRFLVGSRGKSEVSSGASNLGFRLVRSAAIR